MKRPRKNGTTLTVQELEELSTLTHLMLEGRSAFASDGDRRRAWLAHRAEVRRYYRQRYCAPGQDRPYRTEPFAFYCYDAPPDEWESYPEWIPYTR